MSFALTRPQLLDGSKDVTRRAGWANLKPGERFYAVERVMGFRRGEKSVVLAVCECVSNQREYIAKIIDQPKRGPRSEVEREGFPDLTPEDFVKMFLRHVRKVDFVQRIEFKRVAVGMEAAA